MYIFYRNQRHVVAKMDDGRENENDLNGEFLFCIIHEKTRKKGGGVYF
jgi:hypothetical protein